MVRLQVLYFWLKFSVFLNGDFKLEANVFVSLVCLLCALEYLHPDKKNPPWPFLKNVNTLLFEKTEKEKFSFKETCNTFVPSKETQFNNYQCVLYLIILNGSNYKVTKWLGWLLENCCWGVHPLCSFTELHSVFLNTVELSSPSALL